MTAFVIRFFACNIILCGIICLLLTMRYLFRNILSSRMRYNLWFAFLGLLVIPFIPLHPIRFPQIFSLFENLVSSSTEDTHLRNTAATLQNGTADWMNDFTLSVNSSISSGAASIFCGIWITGMFVMVIFLIKSYLRLRVLRNSALPLQNPDVRRLYQNCLNELNIKKQIPVYSSAFLKSPIIVGLLCPRIYLPIHLISDYNASDTRYMLLHELQHYRYKDALANHLMNLAGIFYWFNPLIWYALKEMRNDREVACDTSVLEILEEDDHEDYANTLICFAEKISLSSFPFFAGLGGNMKQIKRRILSIASYRRPTFRRNLKSTTAFLLTVALLLGLAPILSAYAANENHYNWQPSSENISYVDFSSYFREYEGSFVLYDSKEDSWHIHNMEQATLQVSPNSTYKIYSALFGLEESVITPENSVLTWNNEIYPFEAWNADQTLKSAMNASVNWYFQNVDKQLGHSRIYDYIHEIGYGNENINADLSSFWLESSLKISSIEQVELLNKLYNNHFDFSEKNIEAVKDALFLSSSETRILYGKTGTGRVDEQDVNGWFVGCVETNDNIYFFAANIRADANAAGSTASEIALSILSDMNIWE